LKPSSEKRKKTGNFRDADLRTQTDYAAEDADVTFQLYELFAPQLKKENLEELFFNIEMPLMEVLAKMELAGISLMKNGWHRKVLILKMILDNLKNHF
jgi:DNA polymerase-1